MDLPSQPRIGQPQSIQRCCTSPAYYVIILKFDAVICWYFFQSVESAYAFHLSNDDTVGNPSRDREL